MRFARSRDPVADIVNLRRFRKARVRDGASDAAAVNRAKFGQSKSVRQLTKAQAQLEVRRLDGQLLEPETSLKRVAGTSDPKSDPDLA
jgi:Domain of unknown function (DUF4169)